MFSLEQVDRPGQEEFIWAMQSRTTYDNDGEDALWRDRRLTSTPRMSELMNSLKPELFRNQAVENSTKEISTLLPDELISDPENFNERIYDVAIARGRVIGLQKLWDKYRIIGKGGPLRMAQALNSYLGNVMQEAFLYHGDVIKCDGQNFTIMWKQGSRKMADCVHQAVDCGLSIVKNFTNFENDVGVQVAVNIGISCGTASFCAIGSKKRATYVLTGDPLEDAKDMLGKMSYNQVMVDQDAWDNLNSIEYFAKAYDEEYNLYIVSDFSSAWRSIHVANDTTLSGENSLTDTLMAGSYSSITQVTIRREFHDIYKLRPSIGDAVNMKIYPSLKCFIFPPFITTVEANEPIETLIEMRYMVVLVTSFSFEAQSYHEMIKLTDFYYKMINNIIEPYHGYVHRVTYNENELLFYILFGIHGDNQNVDSSNALKAAMKCFKGSENSTTLSQLSMCVVSGWVFCGPVGHHMRRENIIIGSHINKARRFLDEFPNKVTCDLDTFLKSKLDARHFTLQDRKKPEGNTNTNTERTDHECIYEYVERDLSNRLPRFAISQYPILDRDYEIETFKRMMHTISKVNKNPELQRYRFRYEPSGLFLIGEPRSGKTRLIEELAYTVSTEFPMFRLRLNYLDKFVPYQMIYYLFGIPLGIAHNSTIADREAKLSSKLKHLPLDGLECVLNVIFRVNFPKMPVIDTLRPEEVKTILNNMIKFLCRICFTRPWVILIDCGEHIDAESWDLIYSILETHLVLLVVGIGGVRLELPQNVQDVLSLTKCKTLQLLPLDKLFHVTLACQILTCSAIPVQLEKVIQDKSNGNAGWIEKFLTCLIHSNIIALKKTELLGDAAQDLVFPSKELMSRDCLKLTQAIKWKPTQSTIHSAILLHRKKWEIFETVAATDTIRLSEDIDVSLVDTGSKQLPISQTSTNIGPRHRRSSSKDSISRRQTKELTTIPSNDYVSGRASQINLFNICVMQPNGEALLAQMDLDSISALDTRKIMDGLTSYEMTFLKGASVIGDFFLRDMLMFVISCTNESELAIACEHLFDLRIIGCAEGDFRRSLMNYAPIVTDRYTTYDDTIVACNCDGFLISESCQKFSKYANCGYMRFINHDFRNAAYNLLTATQLHDLHTKAMSFLEMSTRKCVSCGNGVFTKILGNFYEEGVLAVKKKRRQTVRGENIGKSSASLLETWDVAPLNSTTSSIRNSSMKHYERMDRANNKQDGIIFQAYTKAGVTGEKAKIPPPFESSDFSCCECDRILACMYHHIRKHYEVTERYDRWLNATLEYSTLCTKNANVALAIKFLNHALEIIKGPYKAIANPGEAWKYNVMKARVLTEIGRARSRIGQTRLAYQAYEKALYHYGYTLPKPSSLRYKIMDSWQYILMATKSRRGIGTKFGYVAEFYDNVSNCLSMMAKLFIHLEMWDNAYIAALWSLKKSLQSEKNFVTLINAFTNIIFISARKRKYGVVERLEIMALDYCRRYKCHIDVNDIRSVTKLYAAIFYIRIQRARFEDAFNIAICVDPMADMLQFRALLIKLFPLFIEMILLRSDVNEVLNAMTTFEQVTGIRGDYIGDLWFHSLAIYFHLQTGCLLVDIKLCEDYYYTQNKRMINLKEPEAERRYFVAIWLWYLRTDNFDIADIWQRKLPETWTVDPQESISNLITTLMYIEGMIIRLTHNMDRKMMFINEEMNTKIRTLLRKMEEQASKVKIIAPRLYHLKAYYHMCNMDEYKGFETLDKAIKLAQNMGNLFDAGWARHSERAWKQNMPTIERTLWKDHANIEMLDYREVESNRYKIVFYTLEMPMYL